MSQGVEVVLDLDTIKGMAQVGRSLVKDVADSLQATMSVLSTVQQHVSTLVKNIDRRAEGYEKLAVANRKMVNEMDRITRVAEILGRSVKGIGEQTEAVEQSIQKLKKTVETAPKERPEDLFEVVSGMEVPRRVPLRAGHLAAEGVPPTMVGLLGQTMKRISMSYLMQGIGSMQRYGPVGETLGQYLGSLVKIGTGPAAAGALRFLGPVGTLIGLGIAGYEGLKQVVEMRQKYTGLTGESGLGPALTYEAKARLLSWSPWTSKYAQQIVESTLRAGYNREEAMMVMDYLAENVRSGLMDIQSSLRFYQEAVDKARLSTVAMSDAVERLGTLAATGRISLEEAQKSFLNTFSSAIGQGMPPFLATEYAMTWPQVFANARVPQLRQWGGPNLSSTVAQFFLAQSVNEQVPGTTVMNLWGRLAGGQVSGTQVAQAAWDAMKRLLLQTLGPFGVRPGMSARQILNSVPGPVLQQIAQLMAANGLAPPGLDPFSFALFAAQVINDRNSPEAIERREMERNRITPERFPSMLADAIRSHIPDAQLIAEIQRMSPEEFARAVRGQGPRYYGESPEAIAIAEMVRRGQFDPLLYRWLQSDAAQSAMVRWRSSRYPTGWREMPLEEAMRLRPNEVFQALQEGSKEIQVGLTGPEGAVRWTSRGLQGLISRQQLGYGPATTTEVVIGFNAETAKYMRVISQQQTGNWRYGEAMSRENYTETGGMPNVRPGGNP